MKRMLRCLLALFCLLPLLAMAEEKILNLYIWSGEIPDEIIHQFEKETGIKVNQSTYENNEVMYAKLRAAKNMGYDVIIPTSYFVDRMRKQDMLAPLDKTQLSNWHHLNPQFMHPAYDPESLYSVPLLWGITGIFYNQNDIAPGSIKKWADLWDKKYNNQLLMLDDIRETFAMALLSLGYSVNDNNPEHIKEAYIKLKTLMPNVKIFASDIVVSVIIDEDATVGLAWNGDAYKAQTENPHVQFVFPEEGFMIWVDNLAILKNAPHKKAAHQFLNFILRPEIAKEITLFSRYPTANLTAQKLLPAEIRNNPTIYPSQEIMRRGQYQTDLSEDALKLYVKYWERLKMSG